MMYKVKTNEDGEQYVEVPVKFTMKVFIDEDNELDEVDSEYVVEMVDDISIEQLGITLSKNIF